MFVVEIPLFSCSPAKCVSMNDQEYKKRPKVININSNELFHFILTVFLQINAEAVVINDT